MQTKMKQKSQKKSKQLVLLFKLLDIHLQSALAVAAVVVVVGWEHLPSEAQQEQADEQDDAPPAHEIKSLSNNDIKSNKTLPTM
jgi:hypothetical protein